MTRGVPDRRPLKSRLPASDHASSHPICGHTAQVAFLELTGSRTGEERADSSSRRPVRQNRGAEDGGAVCGA